MRQRGEVLARRLIAYRNGGLNGSIEGSDLNPNFLPAYVGRGMIFYRLRKKSTAPPLTSPARNGSKP